MSSHLRPAARLFWLAANLGLGILPSLLFFAWIERNCSLPIVPLELGWPWLRLEAELPLVTLWNAGLILAFGALHSALAQPQMQSRLRNLVPLQAVRTVYLMATGLSLLAVMGFWQGTGLLIWAAPLPQQVVYAVSAVLFYACLVGAMVGTKTLSMPEFFGWKQIYQTGEALTRSESTPELVESGLYRHVRHPIYAFTLLAILLTPVLSLDRLLVFLATAIYLRFGIPVEERKLALLFGPKYLDYQKRVPALLPGLKPRVFG